MNSFSLAIVICYMIRAFSALPNLYAQWPSPPEIPEGYGQTPPTHDEWERKKNKLEDDERKRKKEDQLSQPRKSTQEPISGEKEYKNTVPDSKNKIKLEKNKNYHEEDDWGFPDSIKAGKKIEIKKGYIDTTDETSEDQPKKKNILIKKNDLEDSFDRITNDKARSIQKSPSIKPKREPKVISNPDNQNSKSIDDFDGFPYPSKIPTQDSSYAPLTFQPSKYDGPFDFSFNGSRGSPATNIPAFDLGFASMRSPQPTTKKRLLYDLSGGAGLNETKIFNSSLALRVDDHIIGLAYERAQWLDQKTNTGKFTESIYIDYCASVTLDSNWLSIQPCYRYGTGVGFWLERTPLNQIIENEKKRNVLKSYGRFIALVPISDTHDIALEGSLGYSEDVFLFGPFGQFWIKTPLLGFSLGYEVYSSQRQSLSIGISSGFIDLK